MQVTSPRGFFEYKGLDGPSHKRKNSFSASFRGLVSKIHSSHEESKIYSETEFNETCREIGAKFDKLKKSSSKDLRSYAISIQRKILKALSILHLKEDESDSLNEFLSLLNQYILSFSEKDLCVYEKIDFIKLMLKPMLDQNQFSEKQRAAIYQFYNGQNSVKTLLSSLSWHFFEAFIERALAEIEDKPLLPNLMRLNNPLDVIFNNYGLIPEDYSLKGDAYNETSEYVHSFKDKEGWHFDFDSLIYDETQKMIFHAENPGTHENHDALRSEILQEGLFLAIADGCGQSHGATIAASTLLNLLIDHFKDHEKEATTLKTALRLGCQALQKAQQKMLDEALKIEGDTTLAFCYLKGQYLAGIAVGDCKIFVFRNEKSGWNTLDLTPNGRNSKDCRDSGGRIVATENALPEFEDITLISQKLKSGDIVLVTSDGLSDCFDPEILQDGSLSLTDNLNLAISKCQTVEEMKNRLIEEMQDRTSKEKLMLFSGSKRLVHQRGFGKMDNANMCFYTYSLL